MFNRNPSEVEACWWDLLHFMYLECGWSYSCAYNLAQTSDSNQYTAFLVPKLIHSWLWLTFSITFWISMSLETKLHEVHLCGALTLPSSPTRLSFFWWMVPYLTCAVLHCGIDPMVNGFSAHLVNSPLVSEKLSTWKVVGRVHYFVAQRVWRISGG